MFIETLYSKFLTNFKTLRGSVYDLALTKLFYYYTLFQARGDDGSDWCEFEDLPLETKCKIEGMKMMARWLVGLQSDAISARKTFNMLNTVRFFEYIHTYIITVATKKISTP